MKYVTFLIMSLDTKVLLLGLGWEMAKRSPALVVSGLLTWECFDTELL
jgi:hypothetical protein